MEVGVLVLSQVVMWPLAVLLVRRAVLHDGRIASVATAMLVIADAIAAWDPTATSTPNRVSITVVNMSIAVLFAVYPDGMFVPRWIWIPAAAEVGIQVADLASGLTLENVQPWWPAHFMITWGILVIGGQITRYRRRSSLAERQAIRWPILALVVIVTAFSILSVAVAASGVALEDARTTWIANLLTLLPAIGFAIGLLAPALLPVDRVLWWALRVCVGAVGLSLAIWGVSSLLSGLPADARAWWTAVVAASLTVPVVWLGRRTADVVVYGRRQDPLRVLVRLGDSLSATIDPRSVPSAMVDTIAETLGLESVAFSGPPGLWAKAGRQRADRVVAEEFPIAYSGEQLGVLTVTPRPGDAVLGAREREIVAHMCTQAAPALHSTRVVAELIEARSRVIFVREEERKRLRRDLHDELAPTFAGLGLAAAAVESYARSRDDRAGDAAAHLVAGLHDATRQLRDVAYDLRPPVLDDRGLVVAIRERVASPANPVVRVEAPDVRMDLPAAVESAALRIAQEAVANVRRHAAASVCVVRLRQDAGTLRITVDDDGRGIPPRIRPGVGLRSMSERAAEVGGTCVATPRAGGGTRVEAVLPATTLEVAG